MQKLPVRRNQSQQSKLMSAYMATLVAAACFITTLAYAQLPELQEPSTLSGEATTSKFYAGVTADQGLTFASNFAYAQPIDILASIEVEPAHVNSVGNLYILIVLGEEVFIRNGLDTYEIWDGTVEGLKPAVSDKTLQISEPLTIVDDVAFGPAGVSNIGMDLFLAYDTAAVPGELYFNGAGLNFFIEAFEPSSQAIYSNSISPQIVQTKCIVCHTATGIAATSALILVPGSGVDIVNSNFNTMFDYIQNAPNGSERILSKPQGLDSHGGGVQLATGSDDFTLWSTFVNAALNDIAVLTGGTTTASASIFDSVINLKNEEVLRKAALLFAGRLPSSTEVSNVLGADESQLRSTIRQLMSGEGFSEFLMESANDKLLTEAFRGSMFEIVDRKYYPNSAQYFQNPDLRVKAIIIGAALAEGPLRLIDYVVQQELPYTEILTADYTMMNPFSAEIYNSNLSFDDPNNYDEWQPGQITDYFRCSDCSRQDPDNIYDLTTIYPHSGILNSPAFLARYPSTQTNRNRARARWAYYYFLGVDIEGISERTTDQDALQDLNNPTLNNPNCVVCHDIMDPVAGSFQNYNDDGFYKAAPGGLDSLPFSYKRDDDGGYQIGDTWYSDMLMPGFGELLAPNPDNSIQWLADQFSKDSRFGYGAVNFWYPAVIGRQPYTEPENPEDSDYASKLAAYLAEQDMMNSVAANFSAGLAGNGVFNLKDLLVDLVLSNHYRAGSVIDPQPDQQIELDAIGSGKLLTPEQLNRKFEEVTGFSWDYGSSSALGDVYNLIYGGIDSEGITERATQLTTLMSAVVTAMANEVSCSAVNNDFSKAQNQRKLFPFVELTSLPSVEESAIRQNIQYLHLQLLGEEINADSIEVDASFELFAAIRQARIAAGKTSVVSTQAEVCVVENIANPIVTDANQTLRSWAAVLNYLMRDYRFIYE